jgi:two-component system response regulator
MGAESGQKRNWTVEQLSFSPFQEAHLMMINSYIEILLVEDNPNDVELTLHALQKNKLSNPVHVARDGAEALDYIYGNGEYQGRDIEQKPKVILLDLKLPKIDGLEVLRRLKSDPLTETIPVVVLTSSREERDIVDSYKLGVNSYITKPVDFEQFNTAVQQLGMYWLLLNQPPSFGRS